MILFWNTEWEPVGGWFINSALIWVIPSREDTQWVRWYLRKVGDDSVVSIYSCWKHYLKLWVSWLCAASIALCYVSIWNF